MKENKMAKKSRTTLKEAKILLIAFIYFSLVLKENKKINEEVLTTKMRNIFHPLANISSMYGHLFKEATKTIGELSKNWDKKESIDFLLLSVTIVAVYYEVFKGIRRSFSPLKIGDILDIQDECIEMINDEIKDKKEADYLVENTFLFAEFLVKNILCEEKR